MEEDIKEKLENFLHGKDLLKNLRKLVSAGRKSLVIDFDQLLKFDMNLARTLLDNPNDFFNSADPILAEITKLPGMHLRVHGLDQSIKIRDIRAEHVGKFVQVEGIITRASEVRPEVKEAVFECLRCGEENKVLQVDEVLRQPLACVNPTCSKKGPFKLLVENSEFRDWQTIRVQECFEELRGGRMPQQLDSIVRDDFVDIAIPGNHVILTGTLELLQETLRGQPKRKMRVFRKILFVNHIEILQKGVEEAELKPEDEERIKELVKSPWFRDEIISSIAPSIFGYEPVKEAIALQLFGCPAVELPDGTRIRGDSHVLLTGDPGVAKSQMIKWVSQVAPRGLYTSGAKVTGPGLTASAVRDEIGGGWALEAGALVIADGGTACLHPSTRVIHNGRILSMIELVNGVNFKIARSGKGEIEIGVIDGKIPSLNLDDLKIEHALVTLVRRKRYCSEIVKLKFRSGFEIRLTPEHLLLDGNTLEWKKASSFKKSDFVVAPLHLPKHVGEIFLWDILPENCTVSLTSEERARLRQSLKQRFGTLVTANRVLGIGRLPDFFRSRLQPTLGELKNITKALEIEQEWKSKPHRYFKSEIKFSKLTPELGYILGFILGDGSLKNDRRRSSISLNQSIKHLAYVERFKECWNKLFSEFSLRKPKERHSWIRGREVVRIEWNCGRRVLGWLYDFCFGNNLRNLLSSPPKFLAGIFAGLIDSDGGSFLKTCTKKNEKYQTWNIVLTFSGLEQSNLNLLLALRTFDCYGAYKKTSNQIVISGRRDCLALINAIQRLSVKAKKGIISRKRNIPCVSEKVPTRPVAQILNRAFENTSRSELIKRGIWSPIYEYIHERRQPSVPALNKILQKTSDIISQGYQQEIQNLIHRDYFLDQVIEVNCEWYEGYVYDLYVPRLHNFVAEGVIVHNCIDEFDKMSQEDRGAILEGMEQQTVSVAKAGIVATLNSRTAVLAAANPVFGRFDPYKSLAEQINLPPLILSRFDLIFIMRDEPRAELDSDMATHILELHRVSPKIKAPKFDTETLRKIVIYARKHVHPKFEDKEALKAIKEYYVKWRSLAERGELPLPITPRQLESLVRSAKANARMRLSDEVKIEDAKNAMRLVTLFLKEAGIDPETGKVDIDVLMTGKTQSQRQKLDRVLEIIKQLELDYEGVAPIDEVKRLATQEGIKESFVREMIDKEKMRGHLYEPKPGVISRVVK